MSGQSRACCHVNASRLLRRALRAHEQGEFDKAERLYTAVLDHQPDNFDALHGLGLIHYRHGRLDTRARAYSGGAANRSRSRRRIFQPRPGLSRVERVRAGADKLQRRSAHRAGRSASFATAAALPCWSSAARRRRWKISMRVLAAEPRSFRSARQSRQCAAQAQSRRTKRWPPTTRRCKSAPENFQLLTNRAVALRRLDRPHEAVMSARQRACQQAGFCPGAICREPGAFEPWRFRRLARLRSALEGRTCWRRSGAISRRRYGSAKNRSMARPSCCTPNRAPATRCSSSVTRRFWLRAAQKSFSKFSAELARLLSMLAGCDQ